jgi:hypothetical protein
MLLKHKGNTEETAKLRATLVEKEVALKQLAAIETQLQESISSLYAEQEAALELIEDIEIELKKF